MVQHMTAHTSYCNRVTEFSRAFVDIQPSAASKPSIRLAPLMEAVKDAGVEAGRSGMPTAKLTICKKVFRLRACHHVHTDRGKGKRLGHCWLQDAVLAQHMPYSTCSEPSRECCAQVSATSLPKACRGNLSVCCLRTCEWMPVKFRQKVCHYYLMF